MDAVQGLAQSYLFAALPEDLVGPVEAIAEVEHYAAGAIIFHENDEARYVYLLKSGQVTLSFSFQHQNRTLHVDIKQVQPGELFGWSALTARRRLSAQALAEADCEVFRIPGERLRELMDAEPRLGYAVMDRLVDLASHRLHSTREQLRMLLEW